MLFTSVCVTLTVCLPIRQYELPLITHVLIIAKKEEYILDCMQAMTYLY